MSWKKTVYYSKKDSSVCKPPMILTNSSFLSGVKTGHYNVQARTRPLTNSYKGENSKEFIPRKDFLEYCFFNQCFDKGRLKNFVLWFLKNYGQNKTVKLVEQLKNIGFEYASKAGISLGIDDLKIPYKKSELIFEAEKNTTNTIHQYVRGEITGVERFQRLIDTWHSTSESLKQEVINYFEATDILNPVYMMAFSGARGNISQVRQLVGMRGLMSDPQGQIIDFPIRSNFREGLTLTEYLISSYGARKGIVDTALRTANAGYLTRRLVDVAQHVVISHFDCGTHRGIFLKDMKEGNKTIYSLIQRVVGRILARDLIDTSLIPKDQINPLSGVKTEKDKKNENGLDLREYPVIAKRNEEITMDLAFSIVKKFDKIFVRSPLTCETNQLICQLCYGWSLGQGSTLVSIGEAVGVVAAQSIGEPGTQLTMRTFHTGGVFSGDISDQIRAPFDAIVEYPTAIPGTLIRTPEGKIAFLTKGEGSFVVKKIDNSSSSSSETMNKYKIPGFTLLYIRNKQSVNGKEVIAQISTISRKSNATDVAELTIPSEYEGQFFSKSLDFREKFVGDAKLIESTISQLRSQKNPNYSGLFAYGKKPLGKNQKFFPRKNLYEISPISQNDTSSNPFNINYIDKLYEAWNWGYAWILSGKIYELNLRGESCFPKLGDLVNTHSSMNQTQWNFYFNNGPAKMYYTFKEPKFGPRSHGKNFSYGQLYNVTSNSSLENNSAANVTMAQPFFFLDLLKIRFQKYGYILTSPNKSYSFENKFFNDKSLGNDLLFRMYEIHPRISDTISKDKSLTTLQKKQKERGNQTLLHWFPFPSQTSTGGFILFEKVFQNHKNVSSNTKHRNEKNAGRKNERFFALREKPSVFPAKNSFSSLKQKTSNTLPKLSPLGGRNSLEFLPKEKFSKEISPPSSKNAQKNRFSHTKNIQFLKNLNTEPLKVDSQIPLLRSGCEQSPLNVRKSNSFEQNISLGGVASQHSQQSGGLFDYGEKAHRKKTSGFFPTRTKKQSFSSSLKADFIKKLKMELNVEKMKKFSSMKDSSFFKFYKFKGITRQEIKLKPLNTEISKCGYFGMRWKNTYKICVKSRFDNLYNSNLSNTNFRLGSSRSEKQTRGLSVYDGKTLREKTKGFFPAKEKNSRALFAYGEKALMNKTEGFVPTRKFSYKFPSNDDLNLLFNKRILWIPNQFFKLIRTVEQERNITQEYFFPLSFSSPRSGEKSPSEISSDSYNLINIEYNPKNKPIDIQLRPKEVELFFPNPPLFLQKNRQGHLKPFTSFIPFPSLLTAFNSYKGSNLEFDFNSLKNNNKTNNNIFKFTPFKYYKESFMDQSFGFHQKWNYCFKLSNLSTTKQDNLLTLNNKSTKNTEKSSGQAGFCFPSENKSPLGKKELFSRIPKNIVSNSKFGPAFSHFISFSNFISIIEKKNIQTWLTPFKKGDYFSIYSTNTPKYIDSQQSNLSKNFRYYTVISNSIKKQLSKLNLFLHKEQLSLFLLSLDFKPSFYPISPYLNHKIQNSIQKCKEERYRRIFNIKTQNEKFSKKIFPPNPQTFVKNSHNLPATGISNNSSFNYSTNLVLKKGWIYLMKNPSKMMSYHKTIIYPGQVNDLNLNASRPLYLECHTIKDVFDFKQLSLSSNNVIFKSEFKSKKIIKNTNLRYILSTDTELSDKQLNKQKTEDKEISKGNFPGKNGKIINFPEENLFPLGKFFFPSDFFLRAEKFQNNFSNNSKFSSSKESFPVFNFEDFKILYKSQFKQQKQKHKLLLSYLNQLEKLQNQYFSKNDTNTIVLLIQPVEEYNRMNAKELKTYVHESTLKQDSHYKIKKFRFNKDKGLVKVKTRLGIKSNDFIPFHKNEKIDFEGGKKFFRHENFSFLPTFKNYRRNFCLVSPFFSSLFQKKFFETYEYNRQKIAPKELSKFPTSDIKIYPMSLDNNFAMGTLLGNEKIQTPYYRSLNKYKQPINFSPFFISFNRPMGYDSIFKDQNFSLSYQPFSRFDSSVIPSLSSHLSYFLNFYLTLNKNQKMNQNLTKTEVSIKSKILSSNLLKSSFEDITQSFHTDFISRFFESPCFCFQNIFHFKNPILNFETMQRDLSRSSKFSPNKRFRTRNKPVSTSKFSSRLPSSNTKKSSTLFSYSQRNQMFLGVQSIAKTNVFSPFNGEVVSLKVNKGCMILTSSNLISYYLASKDFSPNLNNKNNVQTSYSQRGVGKTHLTAGQPFSPESFNLNPVRSNYPVNNILVKFLNMTDIKLDFDLASKLNVIPNNSNSNLTDSSSLSSHDSEPSNNYSKKEKVLSNISSKLIRVSNLVAGQPKDLNLKVRLGDFCVYGDPITDKTAIQTSGQLIHYNNKKITLRRSQPIFISPKGILHKFDNDFIDPKTPVITLSYQKLKTGDIIQGIPKVEQFFEARTTKRGRFFRDSLPYLLKSLFKRYSNKLPLDLAVRQSFYKIQQILVDGVHRVYKAQGVTISDKHLEVIVKQMTSKVRVIDGAQTGFFPGEVLDLFFVEKINTFLMKKITYEPLVLGITKASLEVDSFLSAASFQQTTRVLSKAAIFRKKDFLKGLKENVILGNLIPAGTGFLVYIDL